MKKIGILTFHDTLNYGASMQCYALQKKMQDLGADVEVIDYKSPRFVKEYSPFFVPVFNFRKVLYMLLALKMNTAKLKKKRIFQKKYIRLSNEYTPESIASANDVYDAFVTGSDQVWNWHLTDFDKVYFLDFVKKGKEKFSYAASFGVSEIEADKKKEYRKLLDNYTSISVREESGAKLIEELIGYKAETAIDPVFLLSVEEWEQIAKFPKESGYILLYSINNTLAYECAVVLSKKTKKKIVYLSAPLKRHGRFKKVTELGPDEFVGWFKAADYVITDSFHGVVSSILFEKQFVVLQDQNKYANANSRIMDLLNKLLLEERIIEELEEIGTVLQPINYKQVAERLNIYIQKSVSILKRIMGVEDE